MYKILIHIYKKYCHLEMEDETMESMNGKQNLDFRRIQLKAKIKSTSYEDNLIK